MSNIIGAFKRECCFLYLAIILYRGALLELVDEGWPDQFSNLKYECLCHLFIETIHVILNNINDEGKWNDNWTGHVTVDYFEIFLFYL